jgi:Neuraminidase (sialidase)
VYHSFDGGQSWTETPQLELLNGWDGTSDPALSWDNKGNAYLVGLPFRNNPNNPCDSNFIGIAVYQSKDGGKTWGSPTVIHQSEDAGGETSNGQ